MVNRNVLRVLAVAAVFYGVMIQLVTPLERTLLVGVLIFWSVSSASFLVLVVAAAYRELRDI